MNKNYQKKLQRASRVKASIKPKTQDRLRLSVFKSNRYIYAQIIDDREGKTLVYASNQNDKSKNAESVGKELAAKASEKKIKQVYFDRGHFAFHGQIKDLATSARSKGLEF